MASNWINDIVGTPEYVCRAIPFTDSAEAEAFAKRRDSNGTAKDASPPRSVRHEVETLRSLLQEWEELADRADSRDRLFGRAVQIAARLAAAVADTAPSEVSCLIAALAAEGRRLESP